MPRVIHFEITADEPERAVGFYRSVFDWAVQKWEGPVDYWLATTGAEGEPGIDGAIVQRMNGRGTINSIGVPSVDEYIRKVEAAGGRVAMPKQTVPGVGYVAYCTDTEGNLFGIFQDDPSAS